MPVTACKEEHGSYRCLYMSKEACIYEAMDVFKSNFILKDQDLTISLKLWESSTKNCPTKEEANHFYRLISILYAF